jgi:hypothetical protein
MKNLNLIVLVIAFGVSSMSFATPTNNPDINKELRYQIIKLLGDFNVDFKSNELTAEVVFTLNSKAELVVVSVNSKDQKLDSYVKSNLNYKKVTVKAFNEGKIFRMPIRIVKKS